MQGVSRVNECFSKPVFSESPARNFLEGEVVELVPLTELLARGGDTIDEEARAALHRSVEEGFDDFERGDTEDAFESLAKPPTLPCGSIACVLEDV